MPLSVVLGLLSALLFAASAAMQQHAAHQAVSAAPAPPKNTGVEAALPVLRTARRLGRDRIWLYGTAANVGGSLVQAAALYFGSVAVVQVLLVSQLIFTLWISAMWDRRRPGVLELTSAVAICAGIAIFLSVPGTAPAAGDVNRPRLLVATLCAAAVVVLLVFTAAGRHQAVRAVPIAVGAGVFFAISAALLKITTDDLFNRGIAATAVDWPGYLLAAANVSGFVLEQDAFATGSLPSAVTAMTITNPVASYFIGVLAFNAHFPSSLGGLTALAGAAALVVVGVAGLAHSPAVMRHKPAPA
ncbi:MAG TPA: DMT family transporter [Actinomycetota bacterium]